MKQLIMWVVVAFALACDRPATPCTLIGCANDLGVEIENAPPGPLIIQAVPIGTPDSTRTITCPGETGCTNGGRLLGFAPVHVHLTVTTTGGVRVWDVRPSYITSRPNGPRCGEICRNGTVRLVWR